MVLPASIAPTPIANASASHQVVSDPLLDNANSCGLSHDGIAWVWPDCRAFIFSPPGWGHWVDRNREVLYFACP